MGQQPFYPPNVAGWRQNRYWISAPAMWAKSEYASYLRWQRFDTTGNLANSRSLSVDQAVANALTLFGIDQPSGTTVKALRQFVDEERAGSQWVEGEKAGLLYLIPLTPEFQLA